MARTILPSGEELSETPSEVKRYLNADGLRQIFRQERLRWNLKANKDIDYTDTTRLFKYTSELHNEGQYQRMEIHTEADNGAYAGYAGVNNDSGVFGLPHKVDKWDHSMSDDSKEAIVNRTLIGAMAEIPGKLGHGLNEVDKMVDDTTSRMSMILFDPFDGRAYLYSNDDVEYVNNDTRPEGYKLPLRTVARIADIPTRAAQLINDLNYITDPDYKHTDNNFTNSNRFILDNIDDRTFVYPEISKDKNGDYIENLRMGLNGLYGYGEADGAASTNSQEDPEYNPDVEGSGDRAGAAANSHGKNIDYSGVNHLSGYLPGIFKSVEELEKVDLVGQRQVPRTQNAAPGAKRPNNYYLFDGIWSPNWFDRVAYKDSYLAQSLNPNNMELHIPETEPVPYAAASSEDTFDGTQLYQWRYNRLDVYYKAENTTIEIIEPGHDYQVGDLLEWTFTDDIFHYKVNAVGADGEIQEGEYMPVKGAVYNQDPSTGGIGIEFLNTTGTGTGAKLAISSKASYSVTATQLKNNLYAYVDVVPTVRSDNTLPWSDTKIPDTQGGRVAIRSTAAGPAYSGINSGRGGDAPNDDISKSPLYEHGGNATAGVHVHLFRYVIDTSSPKWEADKDNGIQVFLGKWVDQGPMGIERPCDIKALLLSNYDTNNFSNYYKFMADMNTDTNHRNPDAVVTGNDNALSSMYLHIDQKDPDEDTIFTMEEIDPRTSKIVSRDVTNQVLYLNAATGVLFIKNQSYKADESKFGYGFRQPGWQALAGAVSR